MKKAIIKSIIKGIIIGLLLYCGYEIGYKKPNFKLLSAHELENHTYHLELQDHSGNSFFIDLTIEKALALGVDTNEIITLSNQ